VLQKTLFLVISVLNLPQITILLCQVLPVTIAAAVLVQAVLMTVVQAVLMIVVQAVLATVVVVVVEVIEFWKNLAITNSSALRHCFFLL
jgi:hypothetical protein